MKLMLVRTSEHMQCAGRPDAFDTSPMPSIQVDIELELLTDNGEKHATLSNMPVGTHVLWMHSRSLPPSQWLKIMRKP